VLKQVLAIIHIGPIAGIAGHEFADSIAKRAGLHGHDHTADVQPVSADGNPYTDMFWLATREIRPGSEIERTFQS